MRSKLFVTPIFLLTIYFCFLVSSGYIISDLRLSEESGNKDGNDSNNETSFSQQSLESDSANTTEEDNLFWAVRPTVAKEEIRLNETKPETANDEIGTSELNKTEAANDDIFTSENPTESLEIDKMVEENTGNDTPSNVSAAINTMDEEITLERNNCQLEIMIRETRDLKIQIKFGKLENNSYGKCCITLNGEENTMLGVLISNLQLYHNASQGEVLKVVTADYGTDFILKEYYSWTTYQPLILTETHRVYIILQYKITNIPLNQQDSHFNLEVFSYHKQENDIHQQETSYSQSFFLSKNDLGNIYKKEKPVFIPYFY